jgi:hypothetical protein
MAALGEVGTEIGIKRTDAGWLRIVVDAPNSDFHVEVISKLKISRTTRKIATRPQYTGFP